MDGTTVTIGLGGVLVAATAVLTAFATAASVVCHRFHDKVALGNALGRNAVVGAGTVASGTIGSGLGATLGLAAMFVPGLNLLSTIGCNVLGGDPLFYLGTAGVIGCAVGSSVAFRKLGRALQPRNMGM